MHILAKYFSNETREKYDKKSLPQATGVLDNIKMNLFM